MPNENIPMPDATPGDKPKVELRSNVGGPMPKFPLDGKDKKKQQIGIIVGAILLLVVIGLGVYAALRPNQEPLTPPENNDNFGNLPGSEDQEKQPVTQSGLSGVACNHPDRRPIGVMLAGDPINRPVSGFAKADMVFELPVLVSGVTRLLAVYQCGEPTDIGSVRSVRHDYLFLAEGIDAIVAHWGGSYHALNRIAVGEFQTLNALTNPHNMFFRKNNLPPPYNGFTTYERAWDALQKLGYRTTTKFEGYDFKDDAPEGERPSGGQLEIAWPGQFRVSYQYNPATNRYDRFWAGVKQVDGEDGALVAPSSVVIMRATNGWAEGPGGYNDVGIEGTGQMTVYQDGKEIKGTWRKDERYKNDPIHFMNEQGDPIIFTRGQVWIMAVDPAIGVTWTLAQ